MWRVDVIEKSALTHSLTGKVHFHVSNNDSNDNNTSIIGTKGMTSTSNLYPYPFHVPPNELTIVNDQSSDFSPERKLFTKSRVYNDSFTGRCEIGVRR